MRKIILTIGAFPIIAMKTLALEIEAPPPPKAGISVMPEQTDNFSAALMELLQKTVSTLGADFSDALQTAALVSAIVIAISLLYEFNGTPKKKLVISGAALIATCILKKANVLILLGTSTIEELSEYGKLLIPVMAAAMAGQGGTTSSAALYAGTTVFDLVLTNLISAYLLPGVCLYLALSVANCAIGESMLKQFRDLVRWMIGWSLKIVLTVFTTYMSITGVVSGTADAVKLKATKITIASVVPVVGGILSDASEAILVSAGLAKSAAGIYGILALLAVFLGPFLKIWIQYAVLKITSALCGIFGIKPLTDLIEDFSAAMGLILAMTGAVCMMLLISTVCFLRGMGI